MTGNSRRATNADDAELIAARMGYHVIDPGTMSFDHQVSLFSNASAVTGQIGAALVNTLFSPTGCKIVGMSPYYPEANYFFWSNLLGPSATTLNTSLEIKQNLPATHCIETIR